MLQQILASDAAGVLVLLLIALTCAIVSTVAILALRVAAKYARENLGLKIDDSLIQKGEQAIKDAVASIEADTKRAVQEGMQKPKSETKSQRAVERARELAPNRLAQWNDNVVRTKLDAEVERVNRESVRPPPKLTLGD